MANRVGLHPASCQHRRTRAGLDRRRPSAGIDACAGTEERLRAEPKNWSGPRRESYTSTAVVRRCPTIIPICAQRYEAKSGVAMRGSAAVWDR